MSKFKFTIFLVLLITYSTKSLPILKFKIETKDLSYIEQLKNSEFELLTKRIIAEEIPNLIFNEYDASLLHYTILLEKEIINQNKKQYKNLLKTLIKLGVDYTIKDKILGKTPIHYAILNKNHIALYVFCKYIKPQKLNLQDTNGNTPLHLAFKLFDEVSISMLMGAGVDMDLKNNFGITTYDLLKNLHEKNETECQNSFEYLEEITEFLESIKKDFFNTLGIEFKN